MWLARAWTPLQLWASHTRAAGSLRRSGRAIIPRAGNKDTARQNYQLTLRPEHGVYSWRKGLISLSAISVSPDGKSICFR